MNIVKLSGTVGKDPMVKYSEKGICMLMVDIAENKTVNGEKTVKWHHVRAVGKIAEDMGNQIQKGANVEFKGVYENYKNGSEKISYVRATAYTVPGKGKMESENEVMISGFLGQDPRAIQNKNGTYMASMQIAENRTVNDKEVTRWHDIRAVGKIAESIADNLDYSQ